MTEFNNINKYNPNQFKPEPYIAKTYDVAYYYPELDYQDVSDQKDYGPCSTCGVSKKTFQINMDLRNAIAKHLYGSANNTTEAINEAAAILRGDSGWAGGDGNGCFTRGNREDLVGKINAAVAKHIKGEGEAVIETVHNIPS